MEIVFKMYTNYPYIKHQAIGCHVTYLGMSF